MTSLPEQISAARQAQLDQGITLIRSLGDQALDRTSRVFSLQLDASRAAVEHSSNAVRQLLAARDPRDLLALGSQSQQHLRTLLDYGHELFSIATSGLSLPMLGNQGAAAPASVAESAAESAATAPAPAPASSFALPTDAAPAATLSVVTSDVEPGAEPTVIAKATSEALDAPVAVPHPVAASVPVDVAVEIALPKVEPVDATPPPAATTVRPVETRGTKGRKKHS